MSPHDDNSCNATMTSAPLRDVHEVHKNKSNAADSPVLYPPINYMGLFLVFLAPALGGFIYGFDIGVTSFALSMMTKTIMNDGGWWHVAFGTIRRGLFVSALSLGALLGSHFLFMTSNSNANNKNVMGRRMELRIAAILYAIGTILNVASGTLFATNTFGFYSVFLGRLIFGIGVGFTMHGAPAYMAEMCPPQVRGAMVSAKETIIVGGIVVGYAVGNIFSQRENSTWTDLYAISFFIAVPMIALTFSIPRSKRWLLLHGHMEEAYDSMQFVYKGDIREAYDHLVATVLVDSSSSSSSVKVVRDSYGSSSDDDSDASLARGMTVDSDSDSDDGEVEESSNGADESPSVFAPKYRRSIMASMGLIVFQQFSGQPSVLSYATLLFGAAGWSGNASVVTAVLMMMTSTGTVLLVERLGRKRMLSACCIVMMSALAALSTTFWGWSEDDPDFEFTSAQKMTLLVAMFVYIGGYQVGFGPITWCLVSEIFPMEIRSKAIALGVELNYLLNFAVQFAFPILEHWLGWGRTFAVFGSVLLAALLFIRIFVPETTGLSLEEIQTLMMQQTSSDDNNNIIMTEQAPLLGAVPTIDEMESQLIRRHSDAALLNQG